MRRLIALERVGLHVQRGELVDIGAWLQRIYGGPYEKCMMRVTPEFEAALSRVYGAPDDEHGAEWN